MKNTITTLLLVLFAATAFAQTTAGFRYQTVLRDLTRQVLVDQKVSFRMGLIEGSPDGPVLYSEKHTRTTNQFGLVSFTIGGGEDFEGDFLEIPWGTSDIYLQVEVDPEGGSDFELMGTSLMLAVPIAVWEISDEDRSAENELQTITIDGGEIILSDGGSIVLPDSSAVNEIQTITIVDGEIFLSLNGGSITLPDDSNTNEIQTLSKDSTEIKLTDGGSVTLNDDDASNEIQTLYFSNNFLELSNGGGWVNLGQYMDSPWTTVGFSQIYYNWQTAIGGSYFSPGAALTVNGSSHIRGGSFRVLKTNGADLLWAGSASGAGYFEVHGSNAKENFNVSSLSTNTNHGYIGVYGTDGWQAVPKARMFIQGDGKGVLAADIKNFVMEHPEKPGHEIWYASLEGPEAAAYERGTAKLENGEVFIPFSDHFEIVLNPETMTVVLTPNDATSLGLAVIEKTPNGIRVKELHNGTGNYTIDWQVTGIRKGFEDYRVVRDAKEALPALPPTQN